MLVSPDRAIKVSRKSLRSNNMKANSESGAQSIAMSGGRLLLVVTILSLSAVPVLAQQSRNPATPANATNAVEAKPADSKKTAKPPFTLTVKTTPILNISLKAEKAKLAQISEALSKKLKIPIMVGEPLINELVTTEFSELTLEAAVQLLAPAVYVDYETMSGPVVPPRALAIFLYAADQAEPSLTAAVHSPTQSFLIEGDTEDGVEPTTEEERKRQEERPLKVDLRDNLMTLKAKKQPLALVLLKIGEQLGIPVDIQYQPSDIVDLEISKTPAEEIIRKLSPNIQMFVRADLTRSERRILRLVLPDPSKTTQ
jgi:hypothetical protein